MFQVSSVAIALRITHQGLTKFKKEGINSDTLRTKNANKKINLFCHKVVRIFCSQMFIICSHFPNRCCSFFFKFRLIFMLYAYSTLCSEHKCRKFAHTLFKAINIRSTIVGFAVRAEVKK
jgi:hypothetical protein